MKHKKFIIGLIPWIVFAVSYDCMRFFPNYTVHSIDVAGLYNLEKSWFGIMDQGLRLVPSEYFALHHWSWVDFLSGLFYLGWVPIPFAFALYLYFSGKPNAYIRFSTAFLLVNWIGFAGYYIHPAAPPWYVMNYGFDIIFHTPGNTGALARFDAITGLPVFDFLYGHNSNVFAAVPSLHAAYLPVTLFYAFQNKCHWAIRSVVAFFMCGIWFTAVYTGHHYIIDVLLGILCACIGIALFEFAIKKYERKIN